MIKKRRRGTVIVETPKGILIASGRRKVFLLPGGEANKHESRRKAAMRELREETGLHSLSSHYLFKFKGAIHKSYKGGHFQDYHKVFLIKTYGKLRPRHEVKYVAWYKPDSKLRISGITKEIIRKYYSLKHRHI